MKFIYDYLASEGNMVRSVTPILLFVIVGKGVGLAISAFFNISNYIVIFIMDILFIVLSLLLYCFILSINGENVTSVRAFIIKSELKKALEREEFVIHYQPQ